MSPQVTSLNFFHDLPHLQFKNIRSEQMHQSTKFCEKISWNWARVARESTTSRWKIPTFWLQFPGGIVCTVQRTFWIDFLRNEWLRLPNKDKSWSVSQAWCPFPTIGFQWCKFNVWIRQLLKKSRDRKSFLKNQNSTKIHSFTKIVSGSLTQNILIKLYIFVHSSVK